MSPRIFKVFGILMFYQIISDASGAFSILIFTPSFPKMLINIDLSIAVASIDWRWSLLSTITITFSQMASSFLFIYIS